MELSVEGSKGLTALRFDPGLEREFRRDLFRRSIGPARVVLVIALCTVAMAGVHSFGDTAQQARDWPLRYGILCPVLAALIPLTYHRRFVRYWQTALCLAMLLVGGGGLAMSCASTVVFAQQGVLNVLLIVFASYTLVRLLFMNAVLTCWGLIAAWCVLAFQSQEIAADVLWTQAFFILTTNVLGMMATRSIETHMRRDFLLRRGLERERQRSEDLLLNILPGSIAERLKHTEQVIADSFADVTVMFADIVDFTPLSAGMPPEQMVDMLNRVFTRFDGIAEAHGIEKIKTIGDGYMAAAGVPDPRADQATAVVRMAISMLEAARDMSGTEGIDIRLRIGVNTGPVVAGVIGARKFIYDLWGDTVNIAKRMESQGIADQIQVSASTAAALGGQFELERRGPIPIKGRGSCDVFMVRRTTAIPGQAAPESAQQVA